MQVATWLEAYLAGDEIFIPQNLGHGYPLFSIEVVVVLHRSKIRAIQETHSQEWFVLCDRFDCGLGRVDGDVDDGAGLGLS